ncbi:MAG: DUF4287 domain-containing protein [bacterium]
MDQAFQTMMDNIYKNTGKTGEEWIELVKSKSFAKHGEIIKFLKEEHSFTHGFANFVALKSKGSDANSTEDKDTLIIKQYIGKENLKSIYNKMISEIIKFGNDIEIAPKVAYVSLRRKKQFAILQPATKTRLEVGLMIKGQEPTGVLEEIKTANSMCSHKINLLNENEITAEVINWIKTAYEKAG